MSNCGNSRPALLLELDDSPSPERSFILRADETRRLALHDASYRLASMLLYSHGYHYIADVFDADSTGWIRYDANSNSAIGVSVEAPTGRAQHEGRSYYAILLAYVRVSDNV